MKNSPSILALLLTLIPIIALFIPLEVQASIAASYGGGGGGGGISSGGSGCREYPVPCASNVNSAETTYGTYEQTCEAVFHICSHGDYEYLIGGGGVIKSLSGEVWSDNGDNGGGIVTERNHLIGDVYLELEVSKQALEVFKDKFVTDDFYGTTTMKKGQLLTQSDADIMADYVIATYDAMIELVAYFEQHGANIKANEIFSPKELEQLKSRLEFGDPKELEAVKASFAAANIAFDLENLGEMTIGELLRMDVEAITSADLAKLRTDILTGGQYSYYLDNEGNITEEGLQAFISDVSLALKNYDRVNASIAKLFNDPTHQYDWSALKDQVSTNLQGNIDAGDLSGITPAYDSQTADQVAARTILDSISTRVTQREIDDFYAGTGSGLNSNPGSSSPGSGWSGRTESQQWAHDVVASWENAKNAAANDGGFGSSGSSGGGEGEGWKSSGESGSSGGGSYNETGDPGDTGPGSPSEGASREGR